MAIQLLGPAQVTGVDGVLSRRDRVVLGALCVRPGDPVGAEALADALWGDEPPKSWPKIVQGSVVRLRKLLGSRAIETTATGYRLAVADDGLDTVAFERLVARGRHFAAVHDPQRATTALTTALELWRGDPFPDLADWDPARAEAARLVDLRRAAEEELVESRLASGHAADAATDARALVVREPYREHRWALLAVSLYRTGRQQEALEVLRRARATLRDDLGLDPGPELVALEQQMLRQDPDLLAAAGHGQVMATCPYQGLRPFDVDDAELFHGRASVVEAALARLAEFPLLMVVGPSGSGKSSLARAGILPARVAAGCAAAVVTPGADPLPTLAAALASLPGDGVLVVDQLEEVFAGQHGGTTAAAYLDRLADLVAQGTTVVATLRADYLAALAAGPRFAALAERGVLLLTPLTPAELRQVIEAPAQQAGLLLEPGLVDLLLRDVDDEPGALPLLSHALAMTWERRDGVVLTVDGYEASGGIRGAVAQSAERLFATLSESDRTTLRWVLLRLVTPVARGDPVAAPVSRRVFGTDPDAARLLDLLVRARLVTAAGDDTVTLAHESLVRAWPRLRGWLDEDAQGQRILAHLQAAADGWEALGRPDDELYRGARLLAAREWAATTRAPLSATESDFLAAGLARDRMQLEARERELQHQVRRNRELVGLLAAVAVLLVLALVAGTFAIGRARAAATASLVADAERIGLRAAHVPDRTQALLLAAAGVRLHDAPSTEANLLAVLQDRQVPVRTRAVAGPATRLTVDRDGSVAVLSAGSAALTLLHPDFSEKVVLFSPSPATEGATASSLRWGAASALAWLGSSALLLSDARTPNRLLRTSSRSRNAVAVFADGWRTTAVARSGDATHVAGLAADASQPVVLAEPVGGGRERRIPLPEPPDALVAGLGPSVVVSTRSGRVQVVDLLTADVRDVPGVRGTAVAASLNGSAVAVQGARGTARVVDLRSGVVGAPVPSTGGPLAVSDGGVRVAVAVPDAVEVRDARTGTLALRLPTGAVAALAWAPDGQVLYVAPTRVSTVQRWDVGLATTLDRQVVASVAAAGTGVSAVDIHPATARLVAGSRDGACWLVDLRTGRVTVAPPAARAVLSVEFTPDGRSFVLADARGAVTVRDSADGHVLRQVAAASALVETLPADAVVSPDGTTVASFNDGFSLREYDVATGLQRRRLSPRLGVAGLVRALGWSPTGDAVLVRAATGSAFDERLVPGIERAVWALVDATDGRVRWRVDEPEPPAAARPAWAPDGSSVTVVGASGQVHVVDAATGAPAVTAHAITTAAGGRTLATAAVADLDPVAGVLAVALDDAAAQLWDLGTGTARGTLELHAAPVAVRFLSAQQLAVAYADGAVDVVDLAPDRWRDLACQAALRDLTAEEWAQYLPDRDPVPVCPAS